MGTWTLEFTTTHGLGGGTATADLDPDFECTITASGCQIKGPQDTAAENVVYTAVNGTLEVDVDMVANVISTCFGGPDPGLQDANIDATYTIDTPPGLVVETGTTGTTDGS